MTERRVNRAIATLTLAGWWRCAHTPQRQLTARKKPSTRSRRFVGLVRCFWFLVAAMHCFNYKYIYDAYAATCHKLNMTNLGVLYEMFPLAKRRRAPPGFGFPLVGLLSLAPPSPKAPRLPGQYSHSRVARVPHSLITFLRIRSYSHTTFCKSPGGRSAGTLCVARAAIDGPPTHMHESQTIATHSATRGRSSSPKSHSASTYRAGGGDIHFIFLSATVSLSDCLTVTITKHYRPERLLSPFLPRGVDCSCP